jgi:hypothetical protein
MCKLEGRMLGTKDEHYKYPILFVLIVSILCIYAIFNYAGNNECSTLITAQTLLKTYQWNIEPSSEVYCCKTDVENFRGIWNSVNDDLNNFAYNLDGIRYSLTDVFLYDNDLDDKFNNCQAELIEIPLVNKRSDQISIGAQFLFIDGIMYVARIQITDIGKDIDNDLLQKMYKEDLSVSWPLDIPIEQFLEDMKMWEDFLNKSNKR